MDLLDWHRERLSERRLTVLVKHLPRDSALNRELHGEAADWSVTDHLLAAAVDHLAAANWMFACVNSAEDGDQPEPPVPVPRPTGPAEEAYDPAEHPSGDTGPESGPAGPDSGGRDPSAPSPAQLARFFA
ncbi:MULTISPECIES: hypothetical protein [unclassified Streptomyces]|uniref:hypothetical protein n=1 Tax=unclassified Streptomyces TaxID=2593676 RepID=UPI003D73EF2F